MWKKSNFANYYYYYCYMYNFYYYYLVLLLLLLLYDLNCLNYCLNPYKPNGLSHPYKVDKSTSIFFPLKQKVKTLIRRRVLWHLIWVYTLCQGKKHTHTQKQTKKNGMLGIKVTKCKYLYLISCRYIQMEKDLKCRNLNTDIYHDIDNTYSLNFI